MTQPEPEVPNNGEPAELAEEATREEEGGGPVPADDREATARRVHWSDFLAVCQALGIEAPARPDWVKTPVLRVEATGVVTDRGYLYMVKSGKKGRHVFVR